MPLDLSLLDSASRLLVEADLKVATGGGGRFQPTGFPDLGPALYRGADGEDWLIVESSQSVANRLELACWDHAAECFDSVCNGIPFIRSVVTVDGTSTSTSTVQESHRLASPYVLSGTVPESEGEGEEETIVNREYWEIIKSEEGLGLRENHPFVLRNHASELFRLDPNSLLHGVWLSTKVEPAGRGKKAMCGGKIRFPRLISGCIEAASPQQANYGGVKRERILDQAESGSTDAEGGFGSIPFPRSDFASPHVNAYFSVDLQLLRTLGLGTRNETIENGRTTRRPDTQSLANEHNQGNFTDEEAFLLVWSLYKVQRFLGDGLNLRSNCQFRSEAMKVTSPTGFVWPNETDVASALTTLRATLFPFPEDSDPRLQADGVDDDKRRWIMRNVTTVHWTGSAPTDESAETTDNQSAVTENVGEST